MKRFIRKDDEAVSPVIAVILMVAITVVLAGVLWAMLSNIGPSETGKISITAQEKEHSNYFTVTISSVSGGDLNLEDAQWNIIDDGGTLEYSVRTTDSDPTEFNSGESKIYPMTKNSAGVTDNVTSNDVNDNSKFDDYENCYIVYIDQDKDSKVSAGDTIHIYKDYDNDGTEDVVSKYIFRIMNDKDISLEKGL